MIGVNSKKNETEIVKEFFQLFKTPYEFYDPQKSYDVVISTKNISHVNSKLLIIYSSEKQSFDSIKNINIHSQNKGKFLIWNDVEYPVYGNILTFGTSNGSFIQIKGEAKAVGFKTNKSGSQIIGIGYDLFQEISLLLTTGQPQENALSPTLEIHISVLRKLILDAGIPLIEIPPIPTGYKFFACLTHDVDFAGIRNHKFDHTMWGFIYRALFGSLIKVFKKKLSWAKLFKNWKAVLSLPGVYLGISRDFWFQFDRYQEIEHNLRSTFFFIPFKNRPGDHSDYSVSSKRAAQYDINDISDQIKKLANHGNEIALHGIDAWQSPEKAQQELDRIHDITGCSKMGVRMHWLFFDQHSQQILEQAGFIYDSTSGYNDAVGYMAGTTQVFRPLDVNALLELPLHLSDTALFYPRRMNMAESPASLLCQKLINNVSAYGGILTINWHHRSLAAERLWGDFYIDLLKKLQANAAYFTTAKQAVDWFQKRRDVSFEQVSFTKNRLKVKFNEADFNVTPPMELRIHSIKSKEAIKYTLSSHSPNQLDVKIA